MESTTTPTITTTTEIIAPIFAMFDLLTGLELSANRIHLNLAGKWAYNEQIKAQSKTTKERVNSGVSVPDTSVKDNENQEIAKSKKK